MKIAFVACSKIQKQPVQPAWKMIENEKPDLLLMLGDNVYGGKHTLTWKKFHENLEERYRKQFDEKHFKQLVAKVPFKAVWDDHDFARGDDAKGAQIKAKHKDRSRELFHRYLRCSTNLPEVYYAFDRGDVRFIMLDVRYYREPVSRTASILGVQQERWLEQQLQHDRRFTVVCSGSCLSEGGEQWRRYRDYYDRFCTLARQAPRVLFLAGSIHKNRFVSHDGFFEAISSGVGRGRRDNYGIVEFGDDNVRIKLRGNKANDNDDIAIDIDAWQVVA